MARSVLLLALVFFAASTIDAAAPPTGKIVGGIDAVEHEFPYQISIRPSGIHFCGGSLIADRFVLTAGHCLATFVGSELSIEAVAGAHNFSAPVSSAVQIRFGDKYWVHESYVEGSVGPDDIAVMRVAEPFELNEFVGLVALPGRNVLHDGVCVISGWGSISFGITPEYPEVLQKAYLPIIEQDQCVDIWEGHPIADCNICAGIVEGGTGVCSGDSGGPLVLDVPDRREQVGIVSWGSVPCGTPNNVGVFVRVSYFIDWIEDKLAQKE